MAADGDFPKDKEAWLEGPRLRPFYLDEPENVITWLSREAESLVLVNTLPPGFSREDGVCPQIIFIGRCDRNQNPHDLPLHIEAFVAEPVYDYLHKMAEKYAEYLSSLQGRTPEILPTSIILTHYPNVLAMSMHPIAYALGP